MQLRYALFATLFLVPTHAFAQPAVDQTPPPEAWTGDATVAQPELGEALRAYENVIAELQQNLPDENTGDLALDYAARAAALHAAAQALAEQFLAKAEDAGDAELRERAEEIVAMEAEAAQFLNEWLEARPAPAAVEEEADTTVTGAAAPVPAQPETDASAEGSVVTAQAGAQEGELDPALAGQGEGVFQQRCSTCHSLEPGQQKAGPSLAGIYGREAASAEGQRYSPALEQSDIVWTEETLDAYIAAPKETVPGTTMAVGLPDDEARQAVIAFLKQHAEAAESGAD